MQVNVCVTVTILSWSSLNSPLLGDSSPHQAPSLNHSPLLLLVRAIFFFFDRGLFIFTGLSEILQRKNYHSHRRTLWRNTLLKSLGSNYLTCFPTSTRGNFSLCVTCSASKLAWSHGFINSLVTCSRCRWLWRSWYGVYSFGEHEILWVEWQLMIFALPHYQIARPCSSSGDEFIKIWKEFSSTELHRGLVNKMCGLRHSLMLLWFKDLMNVTEEVTIHRPNIVVSLRQWW